MRVLVTGASGQLGQSLKKVQPATVEVIYATRGDLDILNEQAVSQYLLVNPVDCIINCAAYTKVDQAEQEHEAAMAGNAKAVANLAMECRKRNLFIIHISTDFLFHGSFNRPITESEKTNPIGIYALSKAAGETAFLEAGCRGTIVRTSWLYSEFGNNFMKTILRLAKEKSELKIIADQHGSPTYAVELASALWRLVETSAASQKSAEIFHFSNYGVTTWYDFAKAIVDIAGLATPVLPILTQEYPLPTPRPAYSALWPRKFSESYEFKINNWRDALKEAIRAGEKL